MKIFNIVIKVILGLILIGPILGVLGIFPDPTPEMYNTSQAYNFIANLMNAKYIMAIMGFAFFVSLVLLFMKRTALVALILLPITINIISFHMFLDGGIFTVGAIMADLIFIINVYLLWQNRMVYKTLWTSRT